MTVVLMIWKLILDVVEAVFGIFKRYPSQVLIVLAALVAVWYVNSWAVQRTTLKVEAQYKSYVAKVEAEAATDAARVKEVEASSHTAATEAAAEIAAKDDLIKQAGATYAAKLAEAVAQKKIEYVYVKVPGTTVDTQLIVEDGQVSCHRLPNQFAEVINNIVDSTNGVTR